MPESNEKRIYREIGYQKGAEASVERQRRAYSGESAPDALSELKARLVAAEASLVAHREALRRIRDTTGTWEQIARASIVIATRALGGATSLSAVVGREEGGQDSGGDQRSPAAEKEQP